MANTHYWPSMTDYQEALQSPDLAFTSPQFRAVEIVENKLGLPRPICGTFASVYELSQGRRHWAIKCFLRNTPDLHERYAKISAHLRKHRRLRYFVSFEYQEEALRVRGQLFPLVKMEWIDACQLNSYIEDKLSNPKALKKLSRQWQSLLEDLHAADIAHGDLQHGNVLVLRNGDLRLIDYDGMWVPALRGQGSNETGHPNFQNPRRTRSDFDLDTDKFSATVIGTAIRALQLDPGLWGKYNNGDNLLFRRSDFVDPRASNLFAELRALSDQQVQEGLDALIAVCERRRRSARKPGRRAMAGQGAATVTPSSWLNDHVENFATQAGASPTQADASAGQHASAGHGKPSRPIGLLKAIAWFFRS